MAKGKKTGGRNFEKGNTAASAHTSGPEKLPAWVRETKKLTAESFVTSLHALHDLRESDLTRIVNDPDVPVKNVIMASWLIGSIEDDAQRQNLFNRLFGKVTDKVEVQLPKPVVITRPSGEQVVLGATLPLKEGA